MYGRIWKKKGHEQLAGGILDSALNQISVVSLVTPESLGLFFSAAFVQHA